MSYHTRISPEQRAVDATHTGMRQSLPVSDNFAFPRGINATVQRTIKRAAQGQRSALLARPWFVIVSAEHAGRLMDGSRAMTSPRFSSRDDAVSWAAATYSAHRTLGIEVGRITLFENPKPGAQMDACVDANREGLVMDIQIENHGSIVLLRPLSDEASDWIDEHIPDDALWFAGALVVEPRYVDDIIEGMSADGLSLLDVRQSRKGNCDASTE